MFAPRHKEKFFLRHPPSWKACISCLYQFALLYGHVSDAEQNPTQETQALVSYPVWKDPLETPSFIFDERVSTIQVAATLPRSFSPSWRPHALLQDARLVLTDFNLRCGCFDAVAWFPTALLTSAYTNASREDSLAVPKTHQISVKCITCPYTWSAYIH